MNSAIYLKEGILTCLQSNDFRQIKIFYFNLKLEIVCVKTIEQDFPFETKIRTICFVKVNSENANKRVLCMILHQSTENMSYYKITLSQEGFTIENTLAKAINDKNQYKSVTKVQSAHNSTIMYQKADGELGLITFFIANDQIVLKKMCIMPNLFQIINSQSNIGDFCVELSEIGYIIFLVKESNWDTLLCYEITNLTKLSNTNSVDIIESFKSPKFQEIFIKSYDWIGCLARIPGSSQFCISSYNKKESTSPYLLEIKNCSNITLAYIKQYAPIKKIICIKSFFLAVFYSNNPNENHQSKLLLTQYKDEETSMQDNIKPVCIEDYRIFYYDEICLDNIEFSVINDNLFLHAMSYFNEMLVYKVINAEHLFSSKRPRQIESLQKPLGSSIDYSEMMSREKENSQWKIRNSKYFPKNKSCILLSSLGFTTELLSLKLKNSSDLHLIDVDYFNGIPLTVFDGFLLLSNQGFETSSSINSTIRFIISSSLLNLSLVLMFTFEINNVSSQNATKKLKIKVEDTNLLNIIQTDITKSMTSVISQTNEFDSSFDTPEIIGIVSGENLMNDLQICGNTTLKLVIFRNRINFYKSDYDLDKSTLLCEWDLVKYYGFDLELTDCCVTKNNLLLLFLTQIHIFTFSNNFDPSNFEKENITRKIYKLEYEMSKILSQDANTSNSLSSMGSGLKIWIKSDVQDYGEIMMLNELGNAEVQARVPTIENCDNSSVIYTCDILSFKSKSNKIICMTDIAGSTFIIVVLDDYLNSKKNKNYLHTRKDNIRCFFNKGSTNCNYFLAFNCNKRSVAICKYYDLQDMGEFDNLFDPLISLNYSIELNIDSLFSPIRILQTETNSFKLILKDSENYFYELDLFWNDFQIKLQQRKEKNTSDINTKAEKSLVKYIKGEYIDSKFVSESKSNLSSIAESKVLDVKVCLAIDTGNDQKILQINKELDTLHIINLETNFFQSFNVFIQEQVSTSNENGCKENYYNLLLKTTHTNNDQNFSQIKYRTLRNEGKVVESSQFDCKFLESEIIEDKLIYISNTFYIALVVDEISNNLNLVIFDIEKQTIDGKFTIGKYEKLNSPKSNFVDAKVLKYYKNSFDDKKETVKIILFFTNKVEILICEYPRNFVVTKRWDCGKSVQIHDIIDSSDCYLSDSIYFQANVTENSNNTNFLLEDSAIMVEKSIVIPNQEAKKPCLYEFILKMENNDYFCEAINISKDDEIKAVYPLIRENYKMSNLVINQENEVFIWKRNSEPLTKFKI